MITQIKNLQKVVAELLEEYPATRDCDRTLLIKVWERQSPYLDSMFTSFATFKVAFLQGKFTNAWSVKRARAKVQEERPALRGRRYKKRKELAVDVRKGINK